MKFFWRKKDLVSFSAAKLHLENLDAIRRAEESVRLADEKIQSILEKCETLTDLTFEEWLKSD